LGALVPAALGVDSYLATQTCDLQTGSGGKTQAMAGHGRCTLAQTSLNVALLAAQADFVIGVAAQVAQ
jgi:hypothetical protein